jgi:hypothetical protein
MSTNDTDIVKLNLNDTFYDWYLRTNQVIDYVNPINVYDVFAGSGLSETRTGTPGTVVFTVATNGPLYGITTLASTQGIEEVVLDYNSLSVSSVANDNVYSFQKSGDVIYKVEASDMLPPDLNGDHAFSGTITVADLIVDDGNITINNTGSNRDNCGIVIQSTSDTNSSNVYFTYDETTSAWYSSQNLGLKQTKAFVTDSATTAIFPFVASETQAQVDIRLQTTTSGIPERFSINAEFDATNTLTFSHYSNNALISDILELTSTGTNGSSVIVKDTITITDVLNSTPFSNIPAVTSVPVTDSTNGYLDKFVNRIKIVSADAGIAVGDFVYLDNLGRAVRTDPTNLQKTYQIGIVEFISGSGVGAVLTIIVSGTIPSGLLTGLTAGSIYYLSETIGEVTSTNPEGTNGTIGKPVFIAASSTTGILLPDFTNIGGGTTVIGGTGSIDNAFSTVTLISGGSGSTTASGETTLGIVLGTNLSGSIGSTTLTINCDIPEIASANRLLRRNNSNAYEWFAPSDFSVIAKPLSTGEITSVQLTPGTLLGRRDDETDSNNPVEALTPSQVLDLLGFSSNSYLKNVIFEDNTGNSVYEYPDTNDGETLTIRSGDNITFENTGTHLIIHAGDITSTNYTPPVSTNGGSTELYTGVEGKPFSYVSVLGFRNSETGIIFGFEAESATTGYVTAVPSNLYLPIAASTGTSSHTAGKTLRILGSAATGVNTVLSTGPSINEDITISLSNTINVKKVAEKGPTYSGLVLSGGNPTTGGDGRDSFKLIDTPNLSRTGTNSSIVMNGWNNSSVISYPDTTRRSWSSAGSEFVSLHADTTTYFPPTGELYTLPFRFFEIIVDKLTVANLTVDTAAKTTEFLGNVIGTGTSGGYTADSSTVVYKNNSLGGVLGTINGSDGILLRFEDDTIGATTDSYIYRPNFGYSANLPESSFIMSNYLSFGNSSDATVFSPTLSRNNANGIKVANLAGSSNEFHITASGAGYAKFGISSGSSGNAYMQFNNGTTTSSFQLKANAVLDVDTLTIGNSSSGYVFESTTFTNTTSDRGKVLTIASVSTGKATVESRYIIKPLGDGTSVGSDPINTLYYVV